MHREPGQCHRPSGLEGSVTLGRQHPHQGIHRWCSLFWGLHKHWSPKVGAQPCPSLPQTHRGRSQVRLPPLLTVSIPVAMETAGKEGGARFCKIMVVEKLLWACVPCHGVSMETRPQTDQTETALGVPQGDGGASPQPSPQNGVLLLAEGTWTCPHVTERLVLHSAWGQDVGGGRDPRTGHPGARGLHPNFLSPACVHAVRKGRITGHGGCSLICITHVHTHSHVHTHTHIHSHTHTCTCANTHTHTHPGIRRLAAWSLVGFGVHCTFSGSCRGRA